MLSFEPQPDSGGAARVWGRPRAGSLAAKYPSSANCLLRAEQPSGLKQAPDAWRTFMAGESGAIANGRKPGAGNGLRPAWPPPLKHKLFRSMSSLKGAEPLGSKIKEARAPLAFKSALAAKSAGQTIQISLRTFSAAAAAGGSRRARSEAPEPETGRL